MDKRERSINFEHGELKLLVNLVEKRKNIIENKKSDCVTWKVKEEAWNKIEREFNSLAPGRSFRSTKTLKTKYEGLKRTVRKKSAAIHRETYKTGGGPNTAAPLNPLEEQVKGLIKTSVDGLPSTFDCDIIPSEDIIVEVIEVPDTSQASVEPSLEAYTNVTDLSPPRQQSFAEPGPSECPQFSWKDWNRNALRSRKNPALTDRRRNVDMLTAKKLELVEIQKQLLVEEMAGKEEERLRRQEEHEEKKKEWAFNDKMRKLMEEEQLLKIKMLNDDKK